jgi:hypothetical protein
LFQILAKRTVKEEKISTPKGQVGRSNRLGGATNLLNKNKLIIYQNIKNLKDEKKIKNRI